MKDKIAVIAQHADNRVDPATYEAVTCARELCAGETSCMQIVVPGDRVEKIAQEISGKTGVDTIAVENKLLKIYNAEAYTAALISLFGQRAPGAPDYILIPHTSVGYDFAPLLAVKLEASCITAVKQVHTADGTTAFVRDVFDGRLCAEVVSKTKTTVITPQPGAWQADVRQTDKSGVVEIMNVTVNPGKTRTIAFRQADYQGAALANSEVIVSAGRGIGNKENLSLIHEVAKLFPRSSLGCSRAVCDAGWLEYSHQVGMTGTTVSPKLYFAIGISGAVQHITGIKGAQTLVAVNNDPAARIFTIADYCIVDDLTQFIPALVEEYKKKYGSSPASL